MQNHALKLSLLIYFLKGAFLASLLLVGIALPQLIAQADGGGFPTATSAPTVTTTPTQAAAKSLGESAPLPAPTFTSQPLANPAAAIPAEQNSTAPTQTSEAASQSSAPVPANGEASTTTKTSLAIPVVIGLAGLAALGIVSLLFILRRKK